MRAAQTRIDYAARRCKFFLRNFATFRQSRYRVSCVVSLENSVWALEFLKFYGAVFLRLNVS